MDYIGKYLAAGFTIIPVPSKQKFPVIKWQQYQTEKPSKDTLDQWFSGVIENLALITGEQSGVCVVDLDSDEAIKFATKHQMFDTPTVKTSRGYHLYYKYEPGMRNFQKIPELPGMDFRAEGGLVIIPPSKHPSGSIYEWVNGKEIWNTEIKELPNILRPHAFKNGSNIKSNLRDEKLSEVKTIPIMDVAIKLGIDVATLDGKNQMKCFTGHDKDTKSFTFYPETNSFHCFGCLIAGSNIDLVMHFKNCGFPEAIQWLKIQFGLVKNNQLKISEITAEDITLLQGTTYYEELPVLFKAILADIKPIDLKRKFADIAGFNKIQSLSKDDMVIIVITELLEVLKKHRFKVTYKNERMYLYNGAYWFVIDDGACDILLVDCATKMGVSPIFTKTLKFRKTLSESLGFESYNMFIKFKNRIAINMQNGTLVIKNGQPVLDMFTHTDFFTYILKFDYDPKATCPMFMKYLNRVLPDQDTQKALQEFFGYIFTKNSDLKLEKILILFGEGHNGKSVMFDIMNFLLGETNISSFNSTDLDQEHYRAMIVDKLLNYSSEFGAGMNVETFKQLASGEPISARHKYGHPFTASNYCRFAFNANTLPKNIENNVAFFRRLLIIPFTETITESEKDVNLANKIATQEASGVFNWVLEGLARIIKHKTFTESAKVAEVLDQYKYERDSVRRFLDDEALLKIVQQSKEANINLKNLYEAYTDFCIDDGIKPLGKVNFSKRLEVLGYPRIIGRSNTQQHIFKEWETLAKKTPVPVF